MSRKESKGGGLSHIAFTAPPPPRRKGSCALPPPTFIDPSQGEESLLSNTARRPMNQEEFDSLYLHHRPPTHRYGFLGSIARRQLQPCRSPRALARSLLSFLPILQWLPSYPWRDNLVNDVIGGLTVGIMQMPQGFAYALLAGVDPVLGLYTCFFPCLLYMLFGTSMHNSIGPFSVVSLMTGRIVEEYEFAPVPRTGNETELETLVQVQSPIALVSAMTLCVGLIQILMAVFRLEIITTYFSDPVVSGFTTAATFHVFISQIAELFGLQDMPRRSGPAYLFLTVWDVAMSIAESNIVTAGLSVASLVFLIAGKEVLSPWLERRHRIKTPIPYELFLVLITTPLARMLHLHSRHSVHIVNEIPTGMPMPSMPRLNLLPELFPSALGIAAVVVAIHISLAKLFAKRFGYRIDPGQELYALGFTACFSSAFPVFPISASLSSSMVKVEAGSKTQLANVFAGALLAAIILYLGRFLRTLPMCVLSVIIIYALKGVFRKFADLKQLWGISKIDFLIWAVSFTVTVGWDLIQGLVVSITFALLTVVFRTQWPRWHFLSNLVGSNDFRDSQRYYRVVAYPGVCIFRFDSPLLFTNVEFFKEAINDALDRWSSRDAKLNRVRTVPDLKTMLGTIAETQQGFSAPSHGTCGSFRGSSSAKPDKTGKVVENRIDRSSTSRSLEDVEDPKITEYRQRKPSIAIGFTNYYRHFVIDCSGFTFVDWMGGNALKEVYNELRARSVLVYFAAAKAPVLDFFLDSGFYQFVPKHNFYPTVRDAVTIAMKRRNQTSARLLEEPVEREYNPMEQATNAHPLN